MKKFKLILIVILASLFLFSGLSGPVFGAGTVTITKTSIQARATGDVSEPKTKVKTVTFTCIGDSSNGSIPNTSTSGTSGIDAHILGWYLYKVHAFPTSGGTAPDAASVMIYDENGMDLLGSVDGGTTPYAGLNLIHATLSRMTLPYYYNAKLVEYNVYLPLMTGSLTLDVDDQATNSADYTIVLYFIDSL